MEVYRITLFGHRDFQANKKTEEQLFTLLYELSRTKPYVEIYVGRNGEFDRFAASIVKRVQKKSENQNCELILVLPYIQKDIEYYERYYNAIVIPEGVEKTHPKSAITRRNRWMVELCDLLICYVERMRGGAYAAFNYAKKLKKPIIRLE